VRQPGAGKNLPQKGLINTVSCGGTSHLFYLFWGKRYLFDFPFCTTCQPDNFQLYLVRVDDDLAIFKEISCNDCPAFQRDHMSVRWFAENFTRLPCVINTTFREKIYSRWCCIDRLSWQASSECGNLAPAEQFYSSTPSNSDDS
jgi:hypothetical protein